MKQDLNFGVSIELIDKELVDLPEDKTGFIIHNDLNERSQYL